MASGLKNSVRAVIFYQGETNARDGVSSAYYKAQLYSLFTSWMLDYKGVEKVYIFQIRQGCGATIENVLKVNQAQKEFVEENAKQAKLISTNASNQADGCHFTYSEGYEVFGKRASWLINSDLYGQSIDPNTSSPYPHQATLVSVNQVTLTLMDTRDTYFLTGSFATNVRLEGAARYTISQLSLNQNALTINFSKLPATGPAPTALTVMSHQGEAYPALVNANNMGSRLMSYLYALFRLVLKKENDWDTTKHLSNRPLVGNR